MPKIKRNLPDTSEVRVCDFCGGEMRRESVTMSYYRFGHDHKFDNVEAEVCQRCGEKYYQAATLEELDRLILAELEPA